MGYYDKHVFFCVNQRDPGEGCCNDFDSGRLRNYVKDKVRELGIANTENSIRINAAGCLGRCDDGPVLVVYPEGVWYSYVDENDLDEIIEEHLRHGRIVRRLKI